MSDINNRQGWKPTNESFSGVERLKPTTTEVTITRSFAGIAALQPVPMASVATNPLYPTAQGSTTGSTNPASPNLSPNPAPNRNR